MKSVKLISVLLLTSCLQGISQFTGMESISISDLQSHMNFLASDELEGRGNGDPGLKIAAQYLASQANRIGLKAIDENSDYLQYYPLYKNSYNEDKSNLTVQSGDKVETFGSKDFYLILPQRPVNIQLKGKVVFAGYGINSEENTYNDFENIDVKDKILLIMNRAPMNKEGDKCQFTDTDWTSIQNIIYKYYNLMMQGPKAVFLVLDPKSGYSSLEDIDPSYSDLFRTSFSNKESTGSGAEPSDNNLNIFLIHRQIADKILEGTGNNLQELQKKIDKKLKPRSFIIPDKEISLILDLVHEELSIPNVAGMVEGSDPVLKHEAIIYVAHYDHIGTDGTGTVFNGADDNASGSVALLEMAEAFMKEEHRPSRSILFLWVSGEEIGLYGSSHYAGNPLIPLENTIATINLDMVGRIRTPSDTGKIMDDNVNVLGGDSISLIGGHQSEELLRMAEDVAKETGMICDYSYNDINHPQRLYYRSDHISFAVHDIPVLFYSTGIHRDYHQATDIAEKINYEKLLKVSRYVYLLGYRLANSAERIVVDKPFSTWQ